MSRHTVSRAAQIICEGADLTDPELWVARRLRSGAFPGLKIGRAWFMTDADIESAIDTCRRGSHATDPSQLVETAPAAAVSIADGLSARARKLRAS